MFIFPLSFYQKAGRRAKHYEAVVSITAFEYTFRRVPINKDGFKIQWYTSASVYAYNVNILGGSIYSIKEHADALIAVSKEIGLEVNAEKN